MLSQRQVERPIARINSVTEFKREIITGPITLWRADSICKIAIIMITILINSIESQRKCIILISSNDSYNILLLHRTDRTSATLS